MTQAPIAILVQARLSSSRLPGKVLAPMAGRPMLQWLVDGLAPVGLPLVLATSVEPSDDALAEFCAGQGVRCVRGPLDDVAARVALAVQETGCEAFVRICGDSPLLDHRLVAQAVELFERTTPDLTTNVFPRTFPKGQSVEVVSAKAFDRARRAMSTPAHREHMTGVFYERPQDFRIESFAADQDWSVLQMSVDTPGDFVLVEKLLAGLDRPHREYGWQELAARMQALREEVPC